MSDYSSFGWKVSKKLKYPDVAIDIDHLWGLRRLFRGCVKEMLN